MDSTVERTVHRHQNQQGVFNMAKQLYQVGEEVVTSLKELAGVLGVSRVASKDLEDGGKYADQVTLLSAEEVETVEDSKEPTTEEVETATSEKDEEVDDWEDMEPIRLKDDTTEEEPHPMEREESEPYSALEEGVEVNAEEVESVMPKFETLDELKEFIKDIDTETLEYMAKGLGLEWKPTEHKNIHRMRVAMSFHEHFFPSKKRAKQATSKGGKYKDYSTEDLQKLLDDNDIEYKIFEDEGITRMRMIMALKKNNILPQ